MATLNLTDIESAIRKSWAMDTCDDVEAEDWTPANPARGQCGVTALVLHDLLGGEIAVAEVHDGEHPQGYHSWLRTAGGLEVDLTRDQFFATEVVGTPRFVVRPQRRPRRCIEQYERLHVRVYGALGLEPVHDIELSSVAPAKPHRFQSDVARHPRVV